MFFSDLEIKELLKAWVAISLAFGVAEIVKPNRNTNLSGPQLLALSGLTVGIGFIIHEVGHKFVAERFGYPAEFRAFDTMLILAVLLSLSGFVFAVPGAVMIAGLPTVEENGKISAAGPGTSLILATLFLLLAIITGPNSLLSYGFQINSWLAFFNLLPFGNLDGLKIWTWNKGVYATLFLAAFTFSFLI